jgi:hypothetical protein
MSAPTTIDAYLDDLVGLLRGRSTEIRRILVEVEEHLHDAVEAGATEAEAIAAFGDPRTIAHRFEPNAPGLLASLVSMAWHLGAIGLIAIGLSGALSLGARATMGSSFVAGDPAGVTYTSARCGDLLRLHPELPSCPRAASAHHADEVAVYRMAAGLLGLGALGVWWLALRRRSSALPYDLEPLLAAGAFGLAAVVLYGQGAVSLAEGLHHGAGQWLTGAIVATGFAAWFAKRAWRGIALRSPALKAATR